VLDRHCAVPSFRGIRQEAWYDATSNRADLLRENPLDDPSWAKGLAMLARRELSFDLLVWHYQLDQARTIFRKFPYMTVILEHCGVPERDKSLDKIEWRAALAAFAREVPNSVLKISAMRVFSTHWDGAEIEAGVLQCIDAFGPKRCMFGSDFPVERPSGEYRQLWQRYAHVTASFSADERTALFAGTAAQTYRITPV
jgi:predicted TIM-barrel fold metal-dependent hydrolase